MKYLQIHFRFHFLYAGLFALIRMTVGLVAAVILSSLQIMLLLFLVTLMPSNEYMARLIGNSVYYLLVYIPVLWFLWMLIYKLMLAFSKQTSSVAYYKVRNWIIGGIIISSIFDLPAILMFGFVIGNH